MEKIISFTRGIPPDESFPKEKLAECASTAILKNGSQTLQYASAAGYEPLRDWIAEECKTAREKVLIGQGSILLLDFFIHSNLNPNDLVFVEQPSYDRSLTLFKRAGIRLKGFSLVNGEIDMDEVEAALSSGLRPKAFYVIPDFQNPSGALMPKTHRKKLLNLADQYNFLIIEDGPYRHLRYSGNALEQLVEINPSRVVLMSSFSKMVSPGLRVGYMIAPAEITASICQYAENSYINASHLNQAIIYNFILNGWMDDHISSLLTIYKSRLAAMLGALRICMAERGTWLEPEGGFFVGLSLNSGFHIPNAQQCSEAGIVLTNSNGFFLSGGENFIRLPFCALTPEKIEAGIERLAKII